MDHIHTDLKTSSDLQLIFKLIYMHEAMIV